MGGVPETEHDKLYPGNASTRDPTGDVILGGTDEIRQKSSFKKSILPCLYDIKIFAITANIPAC